MKNNILRFQNNVTEKQLRAAIVETGRIAYQRGLLMANDGNISTRLPGDLILITPSGCCKGRLTPDDLLVVNLDGEVVKAAANPHLKPTSEQAMHLAVYQQREDIRAAIHAHPPYSIALNAAGQTLRSDILQEVALLLKEVPTTDFALTCTTENALAIQPFIQKHDAIIIRQHGSLTVGRDLEEALINLERLESAAKIQALATMMGQITPLPTDILLRLQDLNLS